MILLLYFYQEGSKYPCSKNKKTMNAISERITIDGKIFNGKPMIRGKRLAVQTVLEFLSAGESTEEILHQYPLLQCEDIAACIESTAYQ